MGPDCRTRPGPAPISRWDDCAYRAECVGGPPVGNSPSVAFMASRSRRSSSRRARMVAKSSAARGLVTFPPIRSVAFLLELYGPSCRGRIVIGLISAGKSRPFSADHELDETPARRTGWALRRIAPQGDQRSTPKRRRHGPWGMACKAIYPCRRSGRDRLADWLLKA